MNYIQARAIDLVSHGVKGRTIGRLAGFLECSEADVVSALRDAPLNVRQAFGLAPPSPPNNDAFKVKK